MLRSFLVLVTLACASTPLSAQLQAAPTHDLGALRVGGTPVSVAIPIRNAGREALRILDIQRGCDCMEASVQKSLLEPGGSTEVRIHLRTLGLADGPKQWHLVLRHQQGDRSAETSVEISANIESVVRVEPPVLAIYATGELMQRITVTDRRKDRTLQVTQARVSLPGVTLRTSRTAPQTHVVEVAVDGKSLPAGKYEGLISIYTDDPTYPQLDVPLHLTRVDQTAVQVVPAAVTCRFSEPKSLASALVRLRGREGRQVAVDHVQPRGGVRCTWSGAGEEVILKLQVDEATAAVEELTLRVHLAQPEARVVDIPVRLVRSFAPR